MSNLLAIFLGPVSMSIAGLLIWTASSVELIP